MESEISFIWWETASHYFGSSVTPIILDGNLCVPLIFVHEIESICRNFLWSQGEYVKGSFRVGWEAVCKPTKNGGLGIRRLAVWNRALTAKSIWDIVSHRNTLWVALVNPLCICQHRFWTVRCGPKWSWILRKLMDLRPVFRRFIRLRVGDGRTADACEDSWLWCGPLSSFISYRFIHTVGFRVGC